MPTFVIDVRLKLVSEPNIVPGLAADVGVLLADTPAPIRGCIAKRSVSASSAGADDDARARVLEAFVPANADGWGFEMRARGHKINVYTGEWTATPDATSFVLTKNDAPFRQSLIVRGAQCLVEYEVCVAN